MEAMLAEYAGKLYGVVWNVIMPTLLLGTGIYLTIGLKLMPIRRLKAGFQTLFSKKSNTHTDAHDGITPMQSLMTALSGTIGAGWSADRRSHVLYQNRARKKMALSWYVLCRDDGYCWPSYRSYGAGKCYICRTF